MPLLHAPSDPAVTPPPGPGDPPARRGRVVAVTGTSGGAGASALAAAIAVRARLAGRTACLVDLDPWGGGLDVVVGAEQERGLRWPDLGRLAGRADGPALLAALPRAQVRGDLPVLAHDPRSAGPGPEVSLEVVTALAGVVDLLVLDRPGRVAGAVPSLEVELDEQLLLVRPGVAGVCALTAHRTAHPVGPPPQVVLRGVDDRQRDDLVVLLAEHFALPVAAVLPDDRSLPRDLLHGVPPGTSRGPLAATADVLLLRLLPIPFDHPAVA
ncbi:hypothetical protein [Lapillicoccus jejuensis]|uniref:Secretion/DNA translocation related CpaE-like protein n=1 Tax=Lapillicoccus jejuensis TaxID=402171 RepID=A0A542DXR3_9MICO|nr:hypothetical protein [Lapillicoccus jejuensis]TQJ07880.1 secretion/DNA translocation related CpaE-like protein [Lapillicoccus jejuensis]